VCGRLPGATLWVSFAAGGAVIKPQKNPLIFQGVCYSLVAMQGIEPRTLRI
jgi:hypothetical protein